MTWMSLKLHVRHLYYSEKKTELSVLTHTASTLELALKSKNYWGRGGGGGGGRRPDRAASILVPQPGIKPVPPAVKACSLNH